MSAAEHSQPPPTVRLLCFLASVIFLLLASATALLRHQPLHNLRLAYALQHLPLELFACAAFSLVLPLIAGRLTLRSTPICIALIAAAFACFWLPILLTAGFVHDDWMLLAGASVRQIILSQPLASLQTLDTVDGNFRPLGTVLYLSYGLRYIGLHPTVLLTTSFCLNLLTTILAFVIVRQLGYSRLAGTAASLTFLSRALIYTESAWTAALGDSLVLAFAAVIVCCFLRARSVPTGQATALHLVAWLTFLLATLAKQSSFALPAVLIALLLIRPGLAPARALSRRLLDSLALLIAYGIPTLAVYHHAKTLLGARTPYPVALNFYSVLHSLSYPFFYLIPLSLPDTLGAKSLITSVFGFLLLAAAVVVIARKPSLLGARPADFLFFAFAALASISLFLLLRTRTQPYYGSMAAFWVSIALGILIAHRANARAALLFTALLITGFTEVRLQQAALLPSGGYLWGTFGMDQERRAYAGMVGQIQPQTRTIVLVDNPDPNYGAPMVILAAPGVQRILALNSVTQSWSVNDHQGLRPQDGEQALTDNKAYRWETPLDPATAQAFIAQPGIQWLRFSGPTLLPPTP